MNKTVLAIVCVSTLPIITTCGGGGSSSGTPQITMMLPLEVEEETPTEIESTPPVTLVDYLRPSHDLQASVLINIPNAARNARNQISFGDAIAYGDFDGDGDEDIFVSTLDLTPNPRPVHMYINDNGTYRLDNSIFGSEVPALVHPRKAITGDYNGDGRLDIFVAGHGYDKPPFPGEKPVLLLSSENGLTEMSGFDHIVGFHHGAASADIDGDGDLDIFVTDNIGDPFFLINDGEGNFDYSVSGIDSEINNSSIFTTELIDVDADGHSDLLVAGHENEGAPTTIYYGDSSGSYVGSRKTVLPAVQGQGVIVDIDVGDLDGDGNNDVVLTRTPQEPFYDGFYIQLVSGIGGRQFSDQTVRIDIASKGATGSNDFSNWITWVRLVDINGDGHLDIFVDARNYFGKTWLNDGSGRMRFVKERQRPFVFDWLQVRNGYNDSQVRQQMEGVIQSADTKVVMKNGSVEVGPVGDFALPQGFSYEQVGGVGDILMGLGYRENESISYLGFGGWMDHSMFGISYQIGTDFEIDTSVYSVGNASGSNPVEGSATWRGAYVAVDEHVVGRGTVYRGDVSVSVDFTDANVDVVLGYARALVEGNFGRNGMTWSDLPLNAGAFGNACSATDCISGMFYGAGHEEVGGIFNRGYLSGAFGGKREE